MQESNKPLKDINHILIRLFICGIPGRSFGNCEVSHFIFFHMHSNLVSVISVGHFSAMKVFISRSWKHSQHGVWSLYVIIKDSIFLSWRLGPALWLLVLHSVFAYIYIHLIHWSFQEGFGYNCTTDMEVLSFPGIAPVLEKFPFWYSVQISYTTLSSDSCSLQKSGIVVVIH